MFLSQLIQNVCIDVIYRLELLVARADQQVQTDVVACIRDTIMQYTKAQAVKVYQLLDTLNISSTLLIVSRLSRRTPVTPAARWAEAIRQHLPLGRAPGLFHLHLGPWDSLQEYYVGDNYVMQKILRADCVARGVFAQYLTEGETVTISEHGRVWFGFDNGENGCLEHLVERVMNLMHNIKFDDQVVHAVSGEPRRAVNGGAAEQDTRGKKTQGTTLFTVVAADATSAPYEEQYHDGGLPYYMQNDRYVNICRKKTSVDP